MPYDKDVQEKLNEILNIISDPASKHLICLYKEDIGEMEKKQQNILENQKVLHEGQELIKKSQERMFDLIKQQDSRLNESDTTFKEIQMNLEEINTFITQKKVQNGYTDMKVEDLVREQEKIEKCLEDKASKGDMDAQENTLESKIQLQVNNAVNIALNKFLYTLIGTCITIIVLIAGFARGII